MSDLVPLTDAEVDLVSGGFVAQVNYSSIDQSASASNSGAVSATAGAGGTAIAIGAAASNTAEVLQANVFSVHRRR
jgi:hypothetical protein